MSIAELRKLPPTEKLKIIEALWGDIAADEESFASPAWHEEALRETETEFAAGHIEILDLEDAKKELRQCSEVFQVLDCRRDPHRIRQALAPKS